MSSANAVLVLTVFGVAGIGRAFTSTTAEVHAVRDMVGIRVSMCTRLQMYESHRELSNMQCAYPDVVKFEMGTKWTIAYNSPIV